MTLKKNKTINPVGNGDAWRGDSPATGPLIKQTHMDTTNKLGITPGNGIVQSHPDYDYGYIIWGETIIGGTTTTHFICELPYKGARTKIDADFIAAAYTAANESGLTPRQLLEQRDELLKALESSIRFIDLSVTESKKPKGLVNWKNLIQKITGK